MLLSLLVSKQCMQGIKSSLGIPGYLLDTKALKHLVKNHFKQAKPNLSKKKFRNFRVAEMME